MKRYCFDGCGDVIKHNTNKFNENGINLFLTII